MKMASSKKCKSNVMDAWVHGEIGEVNFNMEVIFTLRTQKKTKQ